MANQQQHVIPTSLRSSRPNTHHALGDPTDVSPPPHVRAIGVDLTEDDATYIRGKLRTRLDKFARSIRWTSVRVTDLNGPRGGVDQACSITVALKGLPSVIVTRRHASGHAAIDEALHAIEQAVRAILGRRRMKPMRRRAIPLNVSRF
jgi:ribosome-associated translation inhibitor RaiA